MQPLWIEVHHKQLSQNPLNGDAQNWIGNAWKM